MSLESEAAALYSRHPLDNKRSQIRLLVLHPGDWHDRISCDFQVVSLDDRPTYAALSYVWGQDDPDNVADIGGCSMPIRPNLFNALRRLRAHAAGKDTTIWVDAVCINQTSMEERSSQVAMMGQIYSLCAGVSLWFGELEFAPEIWPGCPVETDPGRCYTINHAEDPPESEEIEKIIETIPEWEGLLRIATYLSLMAVRKEKHISARIGALASYPLLKHELMEEHFSKIMRAFESNEWFSRVWVIQEFILAPDVSFYMGPVVMPSTIFPQANERFQSYLTWPYSSSPESLPASCRTLLNTGILKFIQFSDLKNDIRSHTRGLTVLELRLRLSQRFASVDLDQVYSLYGIASYIQSQHDSGNGSRRELIPNYSDSPSHAFTEITLAHFEERQSLLPLSLSSYKHNHPNTPSWVIDWTVLQSDSISFDNHLWTQMYDKFHADRGLDTDTPVFHTKNERLHLQGFLVDEVALVVRYNQASEFSSFMETLRKHEPNAICHGHQDHTWPEAYLRTILVDGVRDYNLGALNGGFNRLPANDCTGKMQRLPFVLQPYCPWRIEDPHPVSPDNGSSLSEHDRMWGKCFWRGGENKTIPPASPHRKELENLALALRAQAKGVLSGRTLFLTKRGYLGVAHKCVPGDEIYIVRGGRTPVILRELQETPDDAEERGTERSKVDPDADSELKGGRQYRVVTDCYLHGFMDGEHNQEFSEEKGFSTLIIA